MLQSQQAPRSLVEDQDAEWRTRKISVMGVVRSFVSQLRPGQELTKVSIPIQLLYPFSILEVVAFRELSFFDQLLAVNHVADPLERMLTVVRWYFCTIQAENWYKKPYNPILGETHYVWTQSPQTGQSCFYAEQVSHHPPISAYSVRNDQEQVTVDATAGFSVKFAGNYVTVTIEGSGTVTLGKLNEKYLLSRRVPDNKITNVIIGTRKMFWVGEITISCPQTGYMATLSFREKSNENFGKAVITTVKDPSDELVVIEGKLSQKFTKLLKGQNKPEQYFNLEDVKKPRINYLPQKDLEPFSSMNVWADANRYQVDNLDDKAEECKKKVESDQRARNEARKQSGEEYVPKMFIKTENGWSFKDAGPYKGKGAKDDDSDDDELPFTKPLKKKEAAPHPIPAPATTATRNSPPPTGASASSLNDSPTDSSMPDGKREKSPSARVSMKIDSAKLAPSLSGDNDVDPKHNILTGWIKLRNAMKNWKNRWFVLRAGRLIYYKAEKRMAKDHCVGILQLADCRVTERATVKEGFSFRIDNIFGHSIYDKRGLKGESIKMAKVPVGWSSAILLVGSEQERRNWMTKIQEQINYATDIMRQKSLITGGTKSASTELIASPHPHVVHRDDDDEDDDDDDIAGIIAKNHEMQKEYFQGLFAQQQKQSKAMIKLFTEVDEHLTNVDKKLSIAIAKASQGQQLSPISIILYTFIAAILVIFFQRLLSRYI